uniref:Leucine-rich repeat-containing N-terminal plant-type domain-containing protein n=1 Tax=Leersia perrieri TaxID=77586 RepID=A0A0D9UX27_9ORYZ
MSSTAFATHGPPLLLHLLILHLLFGFQQLCYSLGTHSNRTAVMPVPCLPDQASALLRLKRSFTVTNEWDCALASWRSVTDCCRWEGVRCGGANGDVGRVTSLTLARCGLVSAAIDPAFFDLTSLRYLNLAWNDFNGSQIPVVGFQHLTELTHLNLSSSKFAGQIPHAIGRLTNLVSLDLSTKFYLFDQDDEFLSLASYSRNWFLVAPNIRSLVKNLRNLKELHLGRVHLSDNNGVEWCGAFSNSTTPNFRFLAYQIAASRFPFLSVVDGEKYNSSWVSLNYFRNLRLAYCNISNFPNALRNMYWVGYLDLSGNQIHGSIPQWAWETCSELSVLNISHNKFSSVGYDYLPFDIEIVDLSYNFIGGPIPIVGPDTWLFDCSNNMFSLITQNFSSQLSGMSFLLASRNNLSREISPSICDARDLQLLDLSYNNFSGSMPSCLMEDINSLNVLNMKGNQLVGELPRNIVKGCALEALDFSDNLFEGRLPRSLVACKDLEVFDIGDNKINGVFPCWMSMLPRLQVLVLRSNTFIGELGCSAFEEENNCEFENLRIFDLASNNFSGTLPYKWFKRLKSMVEKSSNENLMMQYHNNMHDIETYQYATSITYKGHDLTFSKILRTLVVIDVSDNTLHGAIPKSIGELVLLCVLNMSHNALTGSIPSQLGVLHELESLDLSSNDLSGEIPQELAQLHFLSVLNLSYNALVGRIPNTPQFLDNLSYLGNIGLCGFPLSKECGNMTIQNSHPSEKKHVDVILFLFVGLGVGIGFAVIIVVTWGIRVRKRSQDNRFPFWNKIICM